MQDILGEPPYSQERRISDALYKKLRSRTPTQKIQNMVNEGVPFPIKDPALPGREVKRFEADHIVPMNNIVRMEGFEKLTFEQQLEVLNNPENFAGLSRAANSSRQHKSYSEWTHYKKGTSEEIKVDETFRQEMIKKEKELEKILQKQIDDLVEKNSKDNKGA